MRKELDSARDSNAWSEGVTERTKMGENPKEILDEDISANTNNSSNLVKERRSTTKQ